MNGRGKRAYAERGIGELVLAELRVRQATYAERAERLRAQQRAVSPAGVKSLEIGRLVIHNQRMADDYARLIEMSEGTRSDG